MITGKGRLMIRRKPPEQLIAVAWYERDDYDAVRALAEGGGNLHATFDEWLDNASKELLSLAMQGIVVEKFTVKADELAAFLAAGNVQSNEQTRAAFVHHLASAKYADKH